MIESRVIREICELRKNFMLISYPINENKATILITWFVNNVFVVTRSWKLPSLLYFKIFLFSEKYFISFSISLQKVSIQGLVVGRQKKTFNTQLMFLRWNLFIVLFVK